MGRKEEVLKLAANKGLLCADDLESAGISRNYLYTLCEEGLLVKSAVGVYRLPEAEVDEHINLSEVAKRVPNAVIGLLSALSFHEMTTQIPHEVWIVIPRGAWRPKMDYPPLHLNYVSESAYAYGIEEHVLNGVSVKIYSPAKTVADCFKFRNKIGLDVAIEALREVWRARKTTMRELVEAATVDRVYHVMRPYLEAIV